MVVNKQNEASKYKKRTRGAQLKHISERRTSKWETLSDDLKNMTMMMLEDATWRYKNSAEDETLIVTAMKETFERLLSTLKVPNKHLIAEQDIKKHENWLQAEHDRLQRLEVSLAEVLQLETRKVEKLQTKAENLKMCQDNNEITNENCNALSMADEELFQQHLNEFFGEPDEEDEEELGDPSTNYAALAPDRSSRGTQPVSDEDGSDDDDFVPVVVRGNCISQLIEQLDVEPEESSQPSDD
ncbi:hypothetical protein RRG08_066361 [Elysia crispata]|uniref:Uncharacterized protein n=1 Tax=Elysia crispata TaxID=231223 RepID=A0AAE0Y9L1_9GAST|nr:hypothetical protein RRG08_066361 [Elysia crispata]